MFNIVVAVGMVFPELITETNVKAFISVTP
jgi:hypothetical protein